MDPKDPRDPRDPTHPLDPQADDPYTNDRSGDDHDASHRSGDDRSGDDRAGDGRSAGGGASRRPVSRSRSGVVGRRWERTGDEPVTARSALGLRLLLAAVYTPVFVAGAVLFAVWSASAEPATAPSPGSLAVVAALCAALALLSALDLVVVLRRRRRERGPRHH